MSTNLPPGGPPARPILLPSRDELEDRPVRVVIEQAGGFSRFLRWFPWLLLCVSMIANVTLMGAYHSYLQTDPDIEEHFFSNELAARDKVAIVEVSGVIMTGEGFVKRQIDRIRKDPNVKAVVLRVDSPGGTITGSHLIYHRLKELCKEKKMPLVVSMGSLAASGGYYVSMAVGVNQELGFTEDSKTIFVEPTTTTGSIGVILPHYNIEGLMKEWKIENDAVKSHPLKDMGSITRKMTDEERAKFQAYIDESFNRFKDVICYGRPRFAADRAALNKLATGEIFTSTQAIKNGLADQEGYIEDAVKTAIKLARLNDDDVRVVRYKPPKTLLDVMGVEGSAGGRNDLAALLELSTPRAYYLCSWFPSVTATTKER